MKTDTLISDLKAAVKSGKGDYGHRVLCGKAAERITSLIIALKAAEKDLAVVEREISGLAPEAKSTALPLVRFALGITALETICECLPLDARGAPGDLEIFCPKCGKVFRKAEKDGECQEHEWQPVTKSTGKSDEACTRCGVLRSTVNRSVKP